MKQTKAPARGEWNARVALRQGFSLVLVLAFTLAGLTGIYTLTNNRVITWEWEQNKVQLARVMPEADAFSAIRYEDDRPDDIQAAYQDSTLLGYCVQVTADGFSGKVRILVGITPGGEVTGVVVLEEEETMGLGDEEQERAFLDQFIGRSGTITVGRGRNSVDAVTGATTTSEAVAEGVSTALSVVAHLDLEGGGSGDEEGEV